jgi:hypothetical protein
LVFLAGTDILLGILVVADCEVGASEEGTADGLTGCEVGAFDERESGEDKTLETRPGCDEGLDLVRSGVVMGFEVLAGIAGAYKSSGSESSSESGMRLFWAILRAMAGGPLFEDSCMDIGSARANCDGPRETED